MGSRNTRRSRVEGARNSEPEESNSVVTEDTESDNESDLVSVLAFLLRSGQARIVRASSGTSGIHLVHGFSSSDSDDEEYFDDDFAFHDGNVPSPPTDPSPSTSSIDESIFKQDTLLSSGQSVVNHSHNQNICRRLHMRESFLSRRPNFSQGDKAAAGANFIPNKMEAIARYQHKLFCGRHSSDGTVFLSACQDQHIRLYDTTHGKFKEFRDITARDVGWSIIDTDYSPDQQYLIYSSWSDYIHLCNIYGDYETHSALCLSPDDSRFCAFSIKFSHDNKEILAGANDACLYVYDRGSDQRTVRIQAHEDDIDSVTFADASSQILISAADDGLCKVWDRRLLDESCPCPVGVFAGHADGITHIDPRGDGRHLITNSKDQTIKLWDMRKLSNDDGISATKRAVAAQRWDYRWQPVPRKSLRQAKLDGDSSLMTYRGHSVLHTLIRCYFSPMHTTGQRYIYSGCSTGSVVIYDALTGQIVSKHAGHGSTVRDVSWHPYQSEIVSTSWDGVLGLWSYKRKDEDGDVDGDEETDEEISAKNPRRSRRLRFLSRTNPLSF